jgi:hypothetical protein
MKSFSQQPARLGSGVYQSLKQTVYDHNMVVSKPCILSYRKDIVDIPQDANIGIWIVLVLSHKHEILGKRLLQLIKDIGLYDRCYRITLRFSDDINRKIVNLCKLNYNKVFIDQRSVKTMNMLRFMHSSVMEKDVHHENIYMLYFDVCNIGNIDIEKLLIQHTINDWKYCTNLLYSSEDTQSVGLFPMPENSQQPFQYWFDCFWTKFKQPFTTNTTSLLEFSNQITPFFSIQDIENVKFEYEEEEKEEESVVVT